MIFTHYEARDTLSGGISYREIGRPIRKRLDRAPVEALVGQEV